MFSKSTSSKFETQVHLGLLVIIFVLISLNFISNYVTYNTRLTDKKVIVGNLHAAANAISRTLSQVMPQPAEKAVEEYKRQFGLSGLIIIPSSPENASPEARKKWFTDFVYKLPASQVTEVARKILGSDYLTLTRGENNEYFYVYPVLARSGNYLLILSVSSPELAYLDDSNDVVLAITIFSTILIMFTYYMLARYIFTPFRKLRQQAVESGRVVIGSENDALAVAEDYRTAIKELQEKEHKLLELNNQISRRADSLEQFNNYLLQSTNSGIVTLDRNGLILSINDSAAELFGINPAEYIGNTAVKLFPHSSEIGTALNKVMETRRNRSYCEGEILSHKGEKKDVGFSISTVSDDQHQSIGASIILTDLEEIMNLRQELENKNRLAALGEMSGGLAHQLRNSIGTIIGYCNLLKKEVRQQSAAGDYFDELFSEVKETESLVRRFLGFARPLEFQPEQVDIFRLVRESVNTYKPKGRCGDYKITFSRANLIDNGSIVCLVDPLLFKQALNNILDNAVSACNQKSGNIEVTIKASKSTITISVQDNGRGIAPEDLSKLFTPFFSKKPTGTGLGLPVAAKIIDLHGGHITVESNVGVGTTFSIHLPVKVPAGASFTIR